MPADLTKPFAESCCDGGECNITTKSASPCGCDPGANWVCERHKAEGIEAFQFIPIPMMVDRAKKLGLITSLEEATVKESPFTEDGLRYGGVDVDEFVVKDSGKRMEFDSGMVRDVTEDKIDYSLALDGPMFTRLAVHLTKGAKKYTKRNWMKARGEAEADRFKESALRHFLQWYWGVDDEDHAAACYFNINGYEYVVDKMKKPG